MAHLTGSERSAHLAALHPGDEVDHRGTTITPELLLELLDALRDPLTGEAQLGNGQFDAATFTGEVGFDSVTFTGEASFDSAAFTGKALFHSAAFSCGASFNLATFAAEARFDAVTFSDEACFRSTTFNGGSSFDLVTFTGNSFFDSAAFTGDTSFESATFSDDVWFESAVFTGHAWFESAVFTGNAQFYKATFAGTAWFTCSFAGNAIFDSVVFSGDARFESAAFTRDANFDSATFNGNASFGSASFSGNALFISAVFERAGVVGPLVCAGRFVLSGASFGGAVTITAAVRRLECRRTRWSSTASLELRYASVDFAHAVFEYPLTITAEPNPFLLPDGTEVPEVALNDAPNADVRMVSLRGVDAAHLVLSDVDLSRCLFTGTVHLDQVRLEGTCSFDTTPHGTHRQRRRPAAGGSSSREAASPGRRWPCRLPVRLTRRGALAEEHAWRARQARASPRWNPAIFGAQGVGPAQLAPVYRALRKSFEDSKNEPGAADFYYGEMEMRRHDPATARTERHLLTAYWALSGYGLRASRALGWLGAALLITLVLVMGLGLPDGDPNQTATGTVPAGGGRVSLTVDKPDPQLTLPLGERFTQERLDKSVRVVLNSVVFRSSGQDLTTIGTYTEMTSRIAEPVLLSLALLAMRARIKR